MQNVQASLRAHHKTKSLKNIAQMPLGATKIHEPLYSCVWHLKTLTRDKEDGTAIFQ